MTRLNKVACLQYVFSIGIVLSVIGLIVFTSVHNADLWKHLVFGQYVHYFRAFPHHSTFTHAPVRDRVPNDTDDWLGSLLLYETYHYLGYKGLNLWKAIFLVPVLLCLADQFYYRFDIFWMVTSLLLLYGIHEKIYVRAAGFSLSFLAGVMLVLLKLRKTERLTNAYLIVVIVTLWGNIHGSYQLGVVIVLAYLVGLLLDQLRQRVQFSTRELILLGMIIILLPTVVSLVKPYPNSSLIRSINSVFGKMMTVMSGKKFPSSFQEFSRESALWTFVRRYTHSILVKDRPYLASEFQFSLHYLWTDAGIVAFVVLPVLLGGLVCIKGFRWDTSTVFTISVVYWVGLSMARAIPLITVVVLPLIIHESDSLNFSFFGNNSPRTGLEFVVLSFFLVSVLILYTYRLYDEGEKWLQPIFSPRLGLGKSEHLSSELPKYALKRFRSERAFTPIEMGGYVLWKWWPRKKVFLYPKTSAFKESFLREQKNVTRRIRSLNKYGITFAIVGNSFFSHGDNFFTQLSSWILVAKTNKDEKMYLFCRCERK